MPRLIVQFLLTCCVFCLSGPLPALDFSPQERALIAQYGPWPPTLSDDSSNRVSGSKAAIRLGEKLFFDHGLGAEPGFSCASCHDPGRGFTDGKVTGIGRQVLTRNTPTLFNLKSSRWFGWGGENDSLWAQSIRPLLHPDEMAATPMTVKIRLGSAEVYRRLYRDVFAMDLAGDSNERVVANVGKALAAYQETLLSPRTDFDAFRDALVEGDVKAMAAYPESAQRGLRLFIGEGRCNLCHFGPRFSNGEFGDVGIPYFTPDGVDAGRYDGVRHVRANPYNLLGQFNDGDPAVNAISTRNVRLTHRNWGEFKVPGLRGVAATSPYMHNGSLATLREVVLHYSELNPERLHSDGTGILRPLALEDSQVDDLVSFLRSLGEYF